MFKFNRHTEWHMEPLITIEGKVALLYGSFNFDSWSF